MHRWAGLNSFNLYIHRWEGLKKGRSLTIYLINMQNGRGLIHLINMQKGAELKDLSN